MTDWMEALGKMRVQFWACPIRAHGDRKDDRGWPVVTVEWRGDVAHCTAPGCGRTSADPASEGGAPAPCCDMHNVHCEPPGDLCCRRCTEVGHDTFPIRHADGTPCVLPGQPGPPVGPAR